MAGIFHELLAGDRLVRVFSVSRIVHPVVVDLFGLSGGWDALWLDQEHGGMTISEVRLVSAFARANGLGMFVRMPTTGGYALATENLEAGADGLMAAQVHSATEAEQFVGWCKFAPRGLRGINGTGFDADYTQKPLVDFIDQANKNNFVAVQIETLGALEDLDAIAAIDGVDHLFVGPADMSQAMGHPGQMNHPKVWEVIEQVAAACRRHGKTWGTVAADPDYAQRCVDHGCRLLTLGDETLAVRRGVEALKQDYAKFF